MPSRRIRPASRLRAPLLSAALLATFACGGDSPEPPASAPTAEAAPSTQEAGTFTLGEETFEFRVVRCDLTGASMDGILLAGTGTTPDDRRISVEVERLDESETIRERASVWFGSITEGDGWSARAAGYPDGRWFGDEARTETAEGPLLEVAGNALTVAAPFHHRTREESRPGTLRATCPI